MRHCASLLGFFIYAYFYAFPPVALNQFEQEYTCVNPKCKHQRDERFFSSLEGFFVFVQIRIYFSLNRT